MPRVFVSSTSEDLHDFRRAVGEVALEYDWHPIMMEHFGTSAEHTVEFCSQKVLECNLLLLLLAFRRGASPPKDKGGDGIRSYTAYEVETAQEHDIPIRVLMANDYWPGKFWEMDGTALQWMREFRAKQNAAVFFEHEIVEQGARKPLPKFRAHVHKLFIDHEKWLAKRVHETLFPGSALALPKVIQSLLVFLEPHLAKMTFSRQVIRTAYRSSHPKGADDLSEKCDSIILLAEAVYRLAGVSSASASGDSPLLHFLTQLAGKAEDKERESIQDCICVARAILHSSSLISPEEPNPNAFGDVERTKEVAYHALIRVQPSISQIKGEYVVRAWMRAPQTPPEASSDLEELPTEKELWTRENRAAMFGKLYREISRRVESHPFVLEFFVPRMLLAEHLDQWEILFEITGRAKVGICCPVVIRSLERATHPELKAHLDRRWRSVSARFQNPCRIVAGTETINLPGGEARVAKDLAEAFWVDDSWSGQRLWACLSGNSTAACAILNRPPRPGPSSRQMDTLGALWLAGIPIILWPHKSTKNRERLGADLRALLEKEPLDGLPERMHRHRCRNEAQSPMDERLTLVWDDPKRSIPPPEKDIPLYLETR